MSQIRVSETSVWSPQVPRGRADVIIALEPLEAVRVMRMYGNPTVRVLVNTRAIHPIGVIAGDLEYPALQGIHEALRLLTPQLWMIHATEEAARLGDPIVANIVMIGGLGALGILPFGTSEFDRASRELFPEKTLEMNRLAFEAGRNAVLGSSASPRPPRLDHRT